MKKLICAAAAAALVIPGAAIAAHYPTGAGPGGQVNQANPDGFKNRGQCQSALSKEINRQRQNPEERVAIHRDKSASEFQQFMLARFYCDDEGDGWKVYNN